MSLLTTDRPSLSHKISRLKTSMRDAKWRQFGSLLLMGKLTGVSLLVLAAIFFNPGLLGLSTYAADPVLKGNDIVNPINTVWTLIAAFLVFGMQGGSTIAQA